MNHETLYPLCESDIDVLRAALDALERIHWAPATRARIADGRETLVLAAAHGALPLNKLEALCDAVCDLDAFKPRGDTTAMALVATAHTVIQRALGADVGLAYALEDAA